MWSKDSDLQRLLQHEARHAANSLAVTEPHVTLSHEVLAMRLDAEWTAPRYDPLLGFDYVGLAATIVVNPDYARGVLGRDGQLALRAALAQKVAYTVDFDVLKNAPTSDWEAKQLTLRADYRCGRALAEFTDEPGLERLAEVLSRIDVDTAIAPSERVDALRRGFKAGASSRKAEQSLTG